MPAALRRICSKLHLWVGLTLGLVLIVLSVTGSALVFRGELNRILRPGLYHVQPGAERLPLEQLLDSVRTAVPKAVPLYVELPKEEDSPVVVWLEGERLAYVDPYRGTVLGVHPRFTGVMGTLFALHTELMAGTVGAMIVGVSGLLLTLLCVTGLVLWWPSWRRLWVALTVARRRLNYDLHRAGGFYTLAFILLTALTGSALIFYAPTHQLVRTVSGIQALPPPPRSAPPPEHTNPTSLDAALHTALNVFPEAHPSFLYLPLQPRAPITIRLRTEGELHPNGRSYVYVDRYRGTVLRADDAREAPTAIRLLHLLYPLHIGAVGSPVVRVLYVLLGLAPTVLAVTGTLVWYRRWQKKHGRPAPATRDMPTRPADVPVLMRMEDGR